MGRRVIAIDGGEEKHKLCMKLGADHWIDFTKSKDIVGDIKKATGGLGAHAAVVTTASVRFRYLILIVKTLTSHFSHQATLKQLSICAMAEN